jgi:mRNA-degrading endonuclease RelE of RelBE toxin-antitoxin system
VARYAISYSPDAEADLSYLGRRATVLVQEAVDRYLADAPVPVPGQEGHRKALDANPLGVAYRLRVGDYRAYYDVSQADATVEIVRVGHKHRETVYLRGQPFPMRD